MHTLCYHCGETVPKGLSLHVTISGKAQPMCCQGCQAVAQTIIDNGLTDYYKFRTEVAQKSSSLIPDELARHQLLDEEYFQNEFTYQQGDEKETILTIDGMSCAACAWLIEKQITQINGVISINVNATSQRATIKWLPEQLQLSELVIAIEKIGYQALPFKANHAEEANQATAKAFIRRLGVAGILMMQVMMIAIGLYFGAFSYMAEHNITYLRYTSLFLSIPIIFYSAFPFYTGAIKALKAKRLSMDVPVSIAIILAFSASCWATISEQGEVYFESIAMFTFLLLIGKFLEFRARAHAAQASANLLKLMPVTATKIVNNVEQFIAAKHLESGDHVIVKPGETVPADGDILSGTSQLNEAMLTGEQLPITKGIGDKVYAGTINGDANIIIAVTKTSNHSFLSQLIRLSENAQQYKPKIAQLSDKIAQYFVALILVTSSMAAIYWSQYAPDEAFWIALSILVATCPCALSLATPTALTCATTRLNREGILIKSGHVLETLPAVDSFAFDKTGTLTVGEFELITCNVLSAHHAKDDVLAIAAALEAHSEHPLAKAFRPFRDHQQNALDVTVEPACGVKGNINNKTYAIGKIAWLLPEHQAAQYPEAQCALVEGEHLIAIFQLADQIRTEAADVLATLKKSHQLRLLSGDNHYNCEMMTKNLSFDQVYSGLTASDKMAILENDKQHTIAMVGDGVNDTPVFSAAHISIAMGSGTDVAKNGADVILLNNQLSAIITCKKVAQKTQRIIKQNYGWAMGYNAIILPLAVAGYVTPYMAVIGMSASSILVVSNSLRLLKK